MPLAQAGQLSPFTTTSIMWDYKWPNKPDIVMEGGNLAHDGQGFYDESDDLCLLSTFYNPTISHFGSHNMTSAATAQAAWLAALNPTFLSRKLAGDNTCINGSFRRMARCH